MKSVIDYNLFEICAQFDLVGEILKVEAFNRGIINDTFVVTLMRDNLERHYILQRINKSVFKNPEQVMENIQKVTEHIQQNTPNKRRVLRLISLKTGAAFLETSGHDFWRMYNYIDGSATFDTLENASMAYQVGYAFGDFQRQLDGIGLFDLHKTIPGFHNTAKRLSVFREVMEKNEFNRNSTCMPEIEFILDHQAMAPILIDLEWKGVIPTRITHNDTKVNNVLFEKDGSKAICVIDLDTVMPGASLFDFGDLVRSAACPAKEDEKDLSKVYMRMDYFQSIAKGWWDATKTVLVPEEKEHMAFSAKLITYELAMRFLTDYLNNDQYFKTAYEEQNLDRARTQIKLVQSMIEQEREMEDFVESLK